jgi:hypothetical protein
MEISFWIFFFSSKKYLECLLDLFMIWVFIVPPYNPQTFVADNNRP